MKTENVNKINEMISSLEVGTGFETDILSNDEYHSCAGYSKSKLDYVERAPALLEWSINAPYDLDALMTFDFGTALHTLLLEPQDFESQFAVMPEMEFRSKVDKEFKADFIENARINKLMILTHKELIKLKLMHKSALAHPTISGLLKDGVAERSFFFKITDDITLKIRVDYIKILNGQHFLIDVKSIGDISKFDKSISEYRYHVQDAFYSYVYELVTGIEPIFCFATVSKMLNGGRYPARLFTLHEEDKTAGKEAFKRNIDAIERSLNSGIFGGFERIGRDSYTVRKENFNRG